MKTKLKNSMMPTHFKAILSAFEKQLLSEITNLNLTRNEFDVLHVLSNIDDTSKKAVSQKFAASLAGASDYQMTRLVGSLQNKGFVNKIKSSKSKREKAILLTQLGIEVAAKVPQIYASVCQNVFGSLSDDETLQLQKILLKIRVGAEPKSLSLKDIEY